MSLSSLIGRAFTYVPTGAGCPVASTTVPESARRAVDEHDLDAADRLTALDRDRLRVVNRQDTGIVGRQRLRVAWIVTGDVVAALRAKHIAASLEASDAELTEIVRTGVATLLRLAAAGPRKPQQLDVHGLRGLAVRVAHASGDGAAAVERNVHALEGLAVGDRQGPGQRAQRFAAFRISRAHVTGSIDAQEHRPRWHAGDRERTHVVGRHRRAVGPETSTDQAHASACEAVPGLCVDDAAFDDRRAGGRWRQRAIARRRLRVRGCRGE
jgi:hypothetical protein